MPTVNNRISRSKVAQKGSLIPIIITGIEGDIQHSSDFLSIAMYEGANVTLTGTLAIPDDTFKLPVKRNDGRLFIFLAEVKNGAFTLTINLPTSGVFIFSDDEANLDLDEPTFTINTLSLSVIRKIGG